MAPSTYEEFLSPPPPLSAIPYTPLAAEEEGEEEGRLSPGPKKGITLSASDKWRLVKPLFGRYMLPLCVYPSTASFHGNSPITCSLCLPCAFIELYTRCPSYSVMQFEYTINQGISPTLLYPVPSPEKHWFLSKVIHSLRDYYPLWQVKFFSFYSPPYHKLCF
jgi:battenin